MIYLAFNILTMCYLLVIIRTIKFLFVFHNNKITLKCDHLSSGNTHMNVEVSAIVSSSLSKLVFQ